MTSASVSPPFINRSRELLLFSGERLMTADLLGSAPCLGGLTGTAGRGHVPLTRSVEQLSSLRCHWKLFLDVEIMIILEPFFFSFPY